MKKFYPLGRTMNLQLFAEEAPETTAAETTAPADEKKFSQAEVDEIITKRFAKIQREADKRVEQANKAVKTEAERLAAMSAEEREKAFKEKTESEFKAREDALKQREAEIMRKELRAQALETLAEKGLPSQLAEILTYTDADACNASIAAVEKAFRDTVKAEVDKRLAASSAPLTRGGSAPEKPESDAVRLARKRNEAAAEAAKAANNIPSKYL